MSRLSHAPKIHQSRRARLLIGAMSHVCLRNSLQELSTRASGMDYVLPRSPYYSTSHWPASGQLLSTACTMDSTRPQANNSPSPRPRIRLCAALRARVRRRNRYRHWAADTRGGGVVAPLSSRAKHLGTETLFRPKKNHIRIQVKMLLIKSAQLSVGGVVVVTSPSG